GIRDRTVIGVQTCALPIAAKFYLTLWVSKWYPPPIGQDGLGSLRHLLLARFSTEPATLFRLGLLRRHRRLARLFFRGQLFCFWRSEERRVGKGCMFGACGQ